MEQPSIEARRLMLDFLKVEYERVTAELREDNRSIYSGLSVFAFLAGGSISGALLLWDRALIASLLLNLGLPIIIFTGATLIYILGFWIKAKADYIINSLEKRAGLIAAGLLDATAYEQDPYDQRLKPWAWESWAWSPPFREIYRIQMRVIQLLSLVMPLVLSGPIAVGYYRVVSNPGRDAEISSLTHPVRIFLLVFPPVVVGSMVLIVVLVLGLTRRKKRGDYVA